MPPTDSGTGALPEAELQAIAEELRVSADVPGAIVGVQRGEDRWLGASGHEDLLGFVPMRPDRVFRAASLTKMFTAALVMQAQEAGLLDLEDTPDAHVPAFPNASRIRLRQLLSHTAGVTDAWFGAEGPVSDAVFADLGREWQVDEAIELLSDQPAGGEPGEAFRYSNAGYVLLGRVLSQVHGDDYPTLVERELAGPLGLTHTEVAYETLDALMPGYYELAGVPVDVRSVPQRSLLSFAGAAGALHTNADDLLSFARALFVEGGVVGDDSLARMTDAPLEGQGYGHGLMQFCPCTGEGTARRYTGHGHGGNLPGYWSVLVHYPASDVTIVAVINRDVVDGVMLDRSVFDATLAAVLDSVDR